MVEAKDPWIISPFFGESRYKKIVSSINKIPKEDWAYDSTCDRYTTSSKYLDKIAMYELDRTRKEFGNENLLFTYSLLSLYNQENSRLEKHYDDNACTYTIDICLYADEPWPLIVEDKEYSLSNNEALCFYGEDQFHGRSEFSPGNKVLMLFLHFADRDHWYFQADKIG